MEEIAPTPLVSVIIPAYQAARTLGRALDSALNQDYPALEVIVADDGSTDDTRQVVEGYMARDPRVQYLWQANQGIGATRNNAVARARGEYLAMLDADDEWLPGKLQVQVDILQRYSSIGLVFTNSRHVDVLTGASQLFFDLHARALRQLRVEALSPAGDVFRITGGLRQTMYESSFINTSTVVLRASIYRRLGGFASAWRGPEDLDLWLRVGQVSDFAYSTRQFAMRHLQSTSGSRLTDIFTKYMIAYYQMCLRSPEYADLRPQARRYLRKRRRLLVFYYGRHRQPRQAWAGFRDSLADGFDPLCALCALGAWLGPWPFKVAGRLLWPAA
jgi:glycosyltransferase involved in cell wall biosynthesis